MDILLIYIHVSRWTVLNATESSLMLSFCWFLSRKGSCTAADAGLQDGDTVSAIIRKAWIAPSHRAHAFALIRSDGTVLSWGMPNWGGDSSAVSSELRDVQLVQASVKAFAAVRGDGTVITWGDRSSGGDSSKVREELHEVTACFD